MPLLGSTVELTLLPELWMSQPLYYEHEELTPLLICLVVTWVGERAPLHLSSPCLRLVGELSLRS